MSKTSREGKGEETKRGKTHVLENALVVMVMSKPAPKNGNLRNNVDRREESDRFIVAEKIEERKRRVSCEETSVRERFVGATHQASVYLSCP